MSSSFDARVALQAREMNGTPGAAEARSARPPAKGGPFPNVAAPPGSKAGQSQSRFIPREQLGSFTAWQPGALLHDERGGPDRRKEHRSTGDRREGAAPGAAPQPAAAGGAPPSHGNPARAQHPANPAPATAAQTSPPPPPGPSAAEWQSRITAARKAGYQEGYRDGLVALEGFKQSFAQQHTQQLGALLTALDEQLQAQDQELAQALARTAWLLAQQVLRCELQQRPDLVAQVAQQALQAVMGSARQVTLHVHPQDLPLVSQGAEEALAARGARLRADSALQRGGVLVNSELGSVDARLETRWAEAAAALGIAPEAAREPAQAAAPTFTTAQTPELAPTPSAGQGAYAEPGPDADADADAASRIESEAAPDDENQHENENDIDNDNDKDTHAHGQAEAVMDAAPIAVEAPRP
jgi:flagellar assembly protein FliH